jgi:hypothetical protein
MKHRMVLEKRNQLTASQTFIESIQEALDKGLHAIELFFDLSKAYDVINHDLLLDKLNSYGIRGITNLWFKSYLTQRVQFVEINQTDYNNTKQNRYISSSREGRHGIPQGSGLGPLLYLLFINDLPLNIRGAKVVLCADDTNLLITGKDECVLQHKITKVMREVETWLQKSNLIINTEKTIAMSFHSKQMRLPLRPKVIFKNLEIVCKSELRFFGFSITENLKWDAHTRALSSKLCKVVYIIKSLKEMINSYMIRCMYY